MNEKKNKIVLTSRIVAIITVIVSIAFSLVLARLKFIPKKYLLIGYAALAVINLLSLLIAVNKKQVKKTRWFQTIMCGFLSLIMIAGCVLIPVYQGKIEQIFTNVSDTEEMNMDVYVLKDGNYTALTDLNGKKIGLQAELDEQYQTSAMEDIRKQLPEGMVINEEKYDSIFDAAAALYSGEADAILLSSAFADTLAENTDYKDFFDKTVSLYTVTQQIIDDHNKPVPVPNITNTPFIVAVAGTDVWSGNLSSKNATGRTDVNILLVVNPVNKVVQMITIPRDAYVGLGGNNKKMDKLTHASVYSMGTWKKTLESLFDININYYVRVNFSTLVKVVNALGGIDIDNPYAFQTITHNVYEGGSYVPRNYYFEAGRIHLNGNQALLYVRERYNLKDGDQGRNAHQAIVLKELINRVTSSEIINKANSFLNAIKGSFLTDLSMDEIYELIGMQLEDPAKWTIKTFAVTGQGGYAKSYAMGGRELYMNFLDETKVAEAKAVISEMLGE